MGSRIDFTSGETILQYLGSFWTQIFKDAETIRGITDGDAFAMTQTYRKFAQSVNAVSLNSFSPLDMESVYPVFIYRSKLSKGPTPLKYGESAQYGPQEPGQAFEEGRVFKFGEQSRPTVPWYVPVDPQLARTGQTLVNRLFSPSLVWVNGVDFVFDGEVLFFRENPFDNDLIPRRLVPGEGDLTDELIILWMAEAQFDREVLHDTFGYLLYQSKPDVSAEVYRLGLKAAFSVLSGGPSIHFLDSFVASMSGAPVAIEATETVESVSMHGEETMVVTDANVYRISAADEVRDSVVAGAVLYAGAPLTKRTEVFDRFSRPLWWTEVPGLTAGKNLFASDISSLGFMNEYSKVELGSTIQTTNGNFPEARLTLVGSPADLRTFWADVRARSIAQGDFLSTRIWKSTGTVDGDGVPDFNTGVVYNPLKFLIEDLIGPGCIIVKVTQAGSFGPLSASLQMLRSAVPAHAHLFVFLEKSISDELSLAQPSELEQVELDFVPLDALLIEDLGDYPAGVADVWRSGETKTAEALSFTFSPDILTDVLDLPTSAAESVCISNSSSCT